MSDMKKRLKDLRIDNDLSMKELAGLVGTQQSRISDIESGKGFIKADDLPKYAEALNTSVSYIVTGYDPENEAYKDLGLSNAALNKLKKSKGTNIPNILSQIIENRLFYPLMQNIEVYMKPQAEFNKMFTSAVLLHLTADWPYVDNPEDLRFMYQHQVTKTFENIIEIIAERKDDANEKG